MSQPEGLRPPRSVRNNNPGNIRLGEPWQGLMPRDQMSQEQLAEDEFCVFESPRWGFRALGVLLLNYQKLYKLSTPEALIQRFAPPSENDTGAYVADFAKALGISPESPVDLAQALTLRPALRAIAVHEAGNWMFDEAELEAGVAMVV